jgi:exonuclease SbcC
MFKNDLNPFVCNVDNDYPIDRFSGSGQDDIAVTLRIALSRLPCRAPPGAREESRFLRILLISSIAEMLGEFENTLIIEMGADNASRVRERE